MKKNKLNNFVNERRKQLLNKYSISESKFEKLLLDCGIKFTREKPYLFKTIFYYSDFYIQKLNLNIEIDGINHLKTIKYDNHKEYRMYKKNKSLTIRYSNNEVNDLNSVSLEEFKQKILCKYTMTNSSKSINMYNNWIKTIKKFAQ